MKVWAHTRAREQVWRQVCVPADTKCIKTSRSFNCEMCNHGWMYHGGQSGLTCGMTSLTKTGKMLVRVGFIYPSHNLVLKHHNHTWRYMPMVSSSSSSSYLMILTEVRLWRSHVTLKTGSDIWSCYVIWHEGNPIFSERSCYQKFMDSDRVGIIFLQGQKWNP